MIPAAVVLTVMVTVEMVPGAVTQGCLKSITVMAFTSGVKYAGSNLHHNIEIEANGHVGESTLYDLPAEDMKENKGDMWNIDFDSFGIPGCVIPGAIDRVSLIATNADGWNIDSILTIGSMSTGFRVVLTADYDVNRWVDGDSAPENKRFDLQVYHFSGESDCIKNIYVWAFTSDTKYAESDGSHKIEIEANNQIRSVHLPDLPGNDFTVNKGDLFKIPISSFGFTSSCVHLDSSTIKAINIVSDSDDGWNIDSIVMSATSTTGEHAIMIVDIGVDRWIDSNSGEDNKLFKLNKINFKSGIIV